MITLVHEAEGYVFGLFCDNLSVNQKTYSLFCQAFGSLGICSVNHPIPNPKFTVMYVLYDPPQLFKNIRNNWVTEKTQTLIFFDLDTEEEVAAKWKDLIELYNDEQSSDLKIAKLDFKTRYPNNFEKQKVQLVCNVFNERTCVALEKKESMEGTAKFVKYVTRMWNIINIRSTGSGFRLNEPDRMRSIISMIQG